MPAPKKSTKPTVRYSLKKNWDKFRCRRDLQLAGYDPSDFTPEKLAELLREAQLPDIATLSDLEVALKNVSSDWHEVLSFLRPLLEDPEAGRPRQVL